MARTQQERRRGGRWSNSSSNGEDTGRWSPSPTIHRDAEERRLGKIIVMAKIGGFVAAAAARRPSAALLGSLLLGIAFVALTNTKYSYDYYYSDSGSSSSSSNNDNYHGTDNFHPAAIAAAVGTPPAKMVAPKRSPRVRSPPRREDQRTLPPKGVAGAAGDERIPPATNGNSSRVVVSPPPPPGSSSQLQVGQNQDRNQDGVLYPREVDWVRRGAVPFKRHLVPQFPPPPSQVGDDLDGGECSCRNPAANSTSCCRRLVVRTHKFGHVVLGKLFRGYNKPEGRFPRLDLVESCDVCHRRTTRSVLPMRPPSPGDSVVNGGEERPRDFRMVLVFRDLYQAIISGYLYHKAGTECWKLSDGKTQMYLSQGQKEKMGLRWTTRIWHTQLSYNLTDPPLEDGRSLCAYLAGSSEEAGLRAYMDAVFRTYYWLLLKLWATSEAAPAAVGSRTLSVCFEDLSNRTTSDDAVETILDFLYGGDSRQRRRRRLKFPVNDAFGDNFASGHATSHDPDLRRRLTSLIQHIDSTYYSGELAWLGSVLPCQQWSRQQQGRK